MYKKLCLFTCFIAVILIANAATALDQPVAYYPMDEGSGTSVADASGNGNDGTIVGALDWVEGAPDYGTGLDFPATAGNYVNCGTFNPSGTDDIMTVSAWFKVETIGGYQCIVGKAVETSTGTVHWQLTLNATGQVGWKLSGSAGYAAISTAVTAGEWYHVAMVKNGTDGELFLNGESVGTQTGLAEFPATGYEYPVMIGVVRGFLFNGIIDEVALFHAALSQADIQDVMNGALAVKGPATGPKPGNGDSEVSIDSTLSWKPGPFAYTHDVFLSSDFNDVNEATIADPLGATVYPGLAADVNTLDPERFEYGTKYYWRVDEVNESPDTTVFKGKVWSFTTEPKGVALKPVNIMGVTTSVESIYGDQDPNSTYTGNGLDANDMHSTDPKTMWLGMGDGPGDVWIQYEFDKIYKFYNMLIWNYNELSPGDTYGPKDVNVTYSIDNITWYALDDIVQFNKATGLDTYQANTVVDMNNAVAKYIRFTFLNSWSDDYFTGGLSEVRFSVIPTRATLPAPKTKSQNVVVDSVLSWKPGREASVHDLYISTNRDEVEDSTITPHVLSDPNYEMTLLLSQTYYWRVDEVNNAESPSVWESDIWSFSTPSSILIEGFETGYGDTSNDAVYKTWKDGVEQQNSSQNGSYMGRPSPPYLQIINHSGGHSAPLRFNNTSASYSEVTADTTKLQNGSDWSIGNPDALVIWFMADANDVNSTVTDQLYVKLNGGSKIVYNGDTSDIRKAMWMKWEIPLAGISLTNISSITIGVEKIGTTGGTGTIYLDDIQLEVGVQPVNPGSDNLIALYEMEGNVNDTSGSGFNGEPNNGNKGNGGLTYETGKYGKALVFDGNDDYVSLPIGQTISTLTSCTISTWVNYGGGNAWQKVYDFGKDTNIYMDLSADNNTNGVRCSITTGSYTVEDGADSPSVLATGYWEHIVVVIDKENATMKLYRNGDLSASDDAVTVFPENLGVTTLNYLGRSVWSDNPYFKGKIDDFRIYDRALSAGEVKYLFKN